MNKERLEMLLAEAEFNSSVNALQKELISLAGSIYDRVDEFVQKHENELLECIPESNEKEGK